MKKMNEQIQITTDTLKLSQLHIDFEHEEMRVVYLVGYENTEGKFIPISEERERYRNEDFHENILNLFPNKTNSELNASIDQLESFIENRVISKFKK